MAEYYIAPKSSFDATADAIREKTGSQATIEWTEEGFADAIEDIESGGLTVDNMAIHTKISGDLVITSTFIYPYAFARTPITSVSAPNCTYFTDAGSEASGVGESVFRYCTSLTSISFPLLIAMGSGGYQFSGCTALTDIYMPKCSTGQYMFNGCTALVRVALPRIGMSAVQMNGYGFRNCTNLEIVDLGNISQIYTSEFTGCTKLATLVLRRTESITTLNNINGFSNTPFASGKTGGTLYVPADLIATYQSASNWSTILGYANNQIKSIESTHTDPNAPIDLTLYYADGREVVT